MEVTAAAGWTEASAIACVRSAQRSSTCSSPTDRRSRPSGTRPSGSMRAAALDQRLDAAEAGRAAGEPHVVLAAPGGRPVGQLEGEHAAGAGRHLAQRELVIRMAGRPG